MDSSTVKLSPALSGSPSLSVNDQNKIPSTLVQVGRFFLSFDAGEIAQNILL